MKYISILIIAMVTIIGLMAFSDEEIVYKYTYYKTGQIKTKSACNDMGELK